MELAIFLAIFVGLIPAFIAKSKGRNFFVWWFYGWFIALIAIPHSILLKPKGKPCPYCAEDIKEEAKICKHCRKKV